MRGVAEDARSAGRGEVLVRAGLGELGIESLTLAIHKALLCWTDTSTTGFTLGCASIADNATEMRLQRRRGFEMLSQEARGGLILAVIDWAPSGKQVFGFLLAGSGVLVDKARLTGKDLWKGGGALPAAGKGTDAVYTANVCNGSEVIRYGRPKRRVWVRLGP